jgi:hypothetical protein
MSEEEMAASQAEALASGAFDIFDESSSREGGEFSLNDEVE